MSTKRFDGPTLEEAAAAARAELGADAKLVSATRVRTGGLGGFFARERVEVVAEAGPAGARHAAEAAVAAGATEPGRPDAAGAPGAAPAEDEGPLLELLEAMSHHAPTSVIDLADMVDDQAGATFSMPSPTRSPGASRPRWPQAAADPAGAALAAAAAAAATDPALGAPDAEPAPPTHFAAVLERIAQEAQAEPVRAARSRRTDPVSPWIAEALDAGADHAAGALDVVAAQASPAIPVRLGRPAGTAAPGPTTSPAGLVAAAPVAVSVLRDLGVPDGAAPPVSPERRTPQHWRLQLADALRHLPQPAPLPAAPGTVVAVVGRPADAGPVASAIARRLDITADEVVVATGRRTRRTPTGLQLRDAAHAADHRRSLRWRPGPTLVLVEADCRPGGDPWAREVLEALQPSQCWGVVDVTRKTEDLVAWSDALGGFDALAATRTTETTTPGAVLATGVPVGLLDSVPATPEAWAELLCALLPPALVA